MQEGALMRVVNCVKEEKGEFSDNKGTEDWMLKIIAENLVVEEANRVYGTNGGGGIIKDCGSGCGQSFSKQRLSIYFFEEQDQVIRTRFYRAIIEEEDIDPNCGMEQGDSRVCWALD